MSQPDREHEILSTPLTFEYLQRRAAEGWRIHAIEWERAGVPGETSAAPLEQVPYGMRVAGDCHHLEEDAAEVETMMAIMEGIVQDRPLSQIASDLNRRGFRTREGRAWSQVAVFNLLPRLIDFSPRFLSSPQWAERRRALKLLSNSPQNGVREQLT
jgi:hypothetical protein